MFEYIATTIWFLLVGVTHPTISHDFTSSVGLVFDYWKLHGAASVEKCVALPLMRVLLFFVTAPTSPVSISNVINCLLVLLFCICSWVYVCGVCTCDDCLGSWVRLLEFAIIIPF